MSIETLITIVRIDFFYIYQIIRAIIYYVEIRERYKV